MEQGIEIQAEKEDGRESKLEALTWGQRAEEEHRDAWVARQER